MTTGTAKSAARSKKPEVRGPIRHSARCTLHFALCVAGLTLAGCRKPGTEVVAWVNGEPISAQRLIEALPWQVDSSANADSLKLAVLDGLISKEVMVQEAERMGLEESIAYRLELEKKGLVSQELYNAVVAGGNKLTDLDLAAAHRLLATEVNLKLLEVRSEELARQIAAELDKGVPFETLSARHSVHQAARAGGNLGFLPELAVDEPLRSVVLALLPGEHSGPVKAGRNWQLVQLDDRRPADPPPPPLGEMKQELEFRLKQQQRRRLANEYLEKLRARLEFDEEGLDILTKPVDLISAEEQEHPVAVKDGSKYVKVARLLKVARRFPAGLDTAMRKYAVRREIEEDLIFEDGLERGLDKLPQVQGKLAAKRDDLLYEALFKREVMDNVNVGDDEIRAYFEQNKGNFPGGDLASVTGLIRNRVFEARRDSLAGAFRERMRAGADVKVVQAALKAIPLKRDKPKEE